jgi:hypothetical protein
LAAHFAVRLSLLAFAAVSLSGAVARDDFDGTIQLALAAGMVFAALGFVLGDVARRAVEEQVETEFNEWLTQQRDGLSASGHASGHGSNAMPTGTRPVAATAATAATGQRAEIPGAGERPTDPRNQREPRTGAANAGSAPRPTGNPTAGRGRA